MSLIPIECANCGAQYRLPETFQADTAKCKKCGATIDVVGQRDNPPDAEPKKPARKGAASSRSTRSARADKDEEPKKSSRTVRSSKVGTSARRSSRRDDDADGDDDGDGRRPRGGHSSQKSSNVPLLAGGIIGVLAIVLVVLVMVMNWGDEPTKETTAQTPAVTTPEPEKKPAEADANKEEPPAPEEAVAKPAPKPKPKPAELTEDDLFKPKDDLEPVEWPEWISAEDRATVESGLEEIRGGGFTPAKKTIEEMGAKAIPGIVNKLRELNYRDTDDTMFAYELNQLLQAMTAGAYNADFKSQLYGEEISLEDAHWNGKTVKIWQQVAAKFAELEDYDAFIKERKAQRK